MTTLPRGPSAPALVQLIRWVTRPAAMMNECARKYGDAFTIRLPNSTSVFFTAPADIKEIFHGDPDDLHVRPVNAFLGAVLGPNSLLLLDGARHLRERKLMLPPFHGDRMQAYGDLICDITAQVLSGIPRGEPVSVYPKMQEITLEVMLRAVFGMEEGGRLTELRDVLKSFLDQASRPLPVLLAMLFPGERLRHILTQSASPREVGGITIAPGRVLPWGELVRAAARTDSLLYEEIRKRRTQELTGRKDILSLLLQAKDEQGQPMKDIELHDEMITLLIAGYETTANSLAWVFYHLLQNPSSKARLVEELRGAGDSLERRTKLEYLDAVIKESMRLSPAIPVIGRRLERPATIGGYDLPAKTTVVPAIYLTHLRADVWEEPLRFSPERFLGRRVNPYEFYPFGGGVRRCLGMAFALYEMKIVLSHIFSNALVSKAPGREVRPERRGVNFVPSGGMPVVFS